MEYMSQSIPLYPVGLFEFVTLVTGVVSVSVVNGSC